MCWILFLCVISMCISRDPEFPPGRSLALIKYALKYDLPKD